jgi:hypothetical protein
MKCTCNNLDSELKKTSSEVKRGLKAGYVGKKLVDKYINSLDHWIDKNIYGIHRGG